MAPGPEAKDSSFPLPPPLPCCTTEAACGFLSLLLCAEGGGCLGSADMIGDPPAQHPRAAPQRCLPTLGSSPAPPPGPRGGKFHPAPPAV